jgi:hypothetical protein
LKKLVVDHLSENPKYYDKWLFLEKKLVFFENKVIFGIDLPKYRKKYDYGYFK